jgi:hypothetical protein
MRGLVGSLVVVEVPAVDTLAVPIQIAGKPVVVACIEVAAPAQVPGAGVRAVNTGAEVDNEGSHR